MSDKEILDKIRELILIIKENKPNDRGDADRRYAIALTDLEHVYAFWNTYLVEFDKEN